MALGIPPIVRIALDCFKAWWFWLIFILLIAFGFALQQIPPAQHKLVCDTFCTYFRPGIYAAVDKAIGAAPTTIPTTSPTTSATDRERNLAAFLKTTINSYFCDRNEVEPEQKVELHPPTFHDVLVVLPGGLVLAILATSLLPISVKHADVIKRLDQVKECSASLPTISTSRGDETFARRYAELALTARQLRIALTYALLSGLATVLLQPQFRTGNTPVNAILTNWPHLLGQTLAALGAAVWGSYLFWGTGIPLSAVTRRLGFGSIFFGSLIAMAVSLPYQVLRPPELRPMRQEQVLTLLTIRLLILPSIAAIAVAIGYKLFGKRTQ